MSKKNKSDNRGYVYSTDPNFSFQQDSEGTKLLQPAQQALRVWLDTKHRAGKAVTLVTGFSGPNEDLEELGKNLKNLCGAGGSAKDREIVIQGDHRHKILQWLLKNGYKNSKQAGG